MSLRLEGLRRRYGLTMVGAEIHTPSSNFLPISTSSPSRLETMIRCHDIKHGCGIFTSQTASSLESGAMIQTWTSGSRDISKPEVHGRTSKQWSIYSP